MIDQKHIHSVIRDPQTEERYCSTCGEYFDTEFDNGVSLNENSSNIGEVTDLGTIDIYTKHRQKTNLSSNKDILLSNIRNKIQECLLEHNTIPNKVDMNNILFYISKFYDNKQKDKLEPHIRDNIIKDFIYLTLTSNKRYSEAIKFTPKNNSFAVNNYKYVGISNDKLKKIFNNNLMLYRWI